MVVTSHLLTGVILQAVELHPFSMEKMMKTPDVDTVDGRNPAPPGM